MRTWQSSNAIERMRFILFMPITLALGLVSCGILLIASWLAIAAAAAGSLSILVYLQGDPPFRPICMGSANEDWIHDSVQYVCEKTPAFGHIPLFEWSPVFGYAAASAAFLIVGIPLFIVTVICKAMAIGSENM